MKKKEHVPSGHVDVTHSLRRTSQSNIKHMRWLPSSSNDRRGDEEGRQWTRPLSTTFVWLGTVHGVYLMSHCGVIKYTP